MKSRILSLAASGSSRRAAHPAWMRLFALLTAGTFGWTLILAAPAEALTHQTPSKQEGVRKLNLKEMQKILGAMNPQIALGQTGTVVGTDDGQNLVTPYWTISLT